MRKGRRGRFTRWRDSPGSACADCASIHRGGHAPGGSALGPGWIGLQSGRVLSELNCGPCRCSGADGSAGSDGIVCAPWLCGLGTIAQQACSQHPQSQHASHLNPKQPLPLHLRRSRCGTGKWGCRQALVASTALARRPHDREHAWQVRSGLSPPTRSAAAPPNLSTSRPHL